MTSTEDKKAELYKLIKVGGLVFFVPIIMAAGPLAGYYFGNYLENRFGFAPYLSLLCITIGFLVAALETIRIIRLIAKIDKKI